MRLWLSRQRNGEFMLSAFRPSVDPVRGCNFYDLYLIPGDPIGVRGLCREGIVRLFGEPVARDVDPLCSIRVEMTGWRLDPSEKVNARTTAKNALPDSQ